MFISYIAALIARKHQRYNDSIKKNCYDAQSVTRMICEMSQLYQLQILNNFYDLILNDKIFTSKRWKKIISKLRNDSMPQFRLHIS